MTINANLQSILSNLEAKTSELNEEAEKANNLLRLIDAHIKNGKVRYEFWMKDWPIHVTDTTGGHRANETREHIETLLGVSKVGKEWGLAIKRIKVVDGFFENQLDQPMTTRLVHKEPSLLLHESREYRIAASPLIEKFLTKYNLEVEEVTKKLKEIEK